LFKGAGDPKELGFYFALAQVGMEMVLPLGVGVALDNYFAWSPWGLLIGAVVGFVGGLTHLVMLVNRHDAQNRPNPPRDTP
jgi:F0F1-type ATP synthase assembly protein I